jgi:pilus assembly protein CpaF
MIAFYFQRGNSRRKVFRHQGEYCSIGSARNNDLVLKTRHVSKRHAEIRLNTTGLHIDDLGSMSGTWVNKERVVTYGPITENDEIILGDIRIWFDQTQTLPAANSQEPAALNDVAAKESYGGSMQTQQASGHTLTSDEVDQDDQTELLYWGKIVHERLIQQMDLRRKDVHRMTDEQLRQDSEALLDEIIETVSEEIPVEVNLELLKINVLNEAVGLGPLEKFLDDESITEIMVNNHREIFIERNGKLQKSPFSFSSDQAVYAVIERIITPIGRRIDESSPLVDARLKDGSRVNAVIPPLALKGPCITIRKFAKKRLRFDDLLDYGSISESMVEFLRICVEKRKNIIVSGGTGSGKTTLLNVLSNFIPDRERIVTIEDAAELKLVQPNLVSLEARPANLEGRGQIAIRDLVKNSLRMRPDRIVVGECRGGEALDMLQAMNTGHDGSLTTAHANSPRDALSRLEVMVLMAGMDLPVSAIREQVASAVDIIIQQTRYSCGSRKVNKITEVVGIEGQTVQLQDIFVFKQEGIDEEGNVKGRFTPTGFIPTFFEELRASGHDVDLSLFKTAGGGFE